MRYQKIEIKIWNDEKFLALDVHAQRLFFYLLTSPHTNLVGLFLLKPGYACEDMKCLPKDFERDMQKLAQNGFIEYDKVNFVVFIKNYLKYNPLDTPNKKISAKNILIDLPKTYLKQRLTGLIMEIKGEEDEDIFNPSVTLPHGKRNPSAIQAHPEAEAEAEAVTEAVTVTEEERIVKENNTVQLCAEPTPETNSADFSEFSGTIGGGSKPETLKKPTAKKLTEEEWLESLKGNIAYRGLDVTAIHGKLLAWCELKGKKPTRARLLNWLNREEVPLASKVTPMYSKHSAAAMRMIEKIREDKAIELREG